MSYPGGKGAQGVVQTIINQQPPHSIYIEPFLGSGIVLQTKRPAATSLGFDLSEKAISALKRWDGQNTEIKLGDGLEYLKSHTFTPDTLIYCDPPYPITSRDRKRKLYEFELDESDHISLLLALTGFKCMVQISTYANSLYSHMLQGWRLLEFEAMTRGGLRTEQLWMNYPEPRTLHDYRYLGADYRERERIARKVDRWQRRIAKLPQLERLALVSAITTDTAEPVNAYSIARNGDRIPRTGCTVTVLFAHADSEYKKMRGVEVYDAQRGAANWPGGTPVVAHPPCAQWGRLRELATPEAAAKALGPWAVDQVRKWGGVLEHPAGSTLWQHCQLPQPGQVDKYGGWTLDLDQVIFGHKAQKATWLYICGIQPEAAPELPPPGHRPTHCITGCKSSYVKLPELSKKLRELTPPAFAEWLVGLARRCNPGL